MATTEIQDYLLGGGTFESLEAAFAIKAKRHKRYPNLVLFKYDQIHSPFVEQIVQECRGIILDQDNDWTIVSRAFNKFFNHGEGLAAEVDWTTARVQEKVDGSLVVLYFYDGHWNVATTGTPDASGEVNDFGITFEDYFWKTWGDNPPPPPVAGISIMFELSGPINRVVVDHREPNLTLLGGRDLEKRELPPEVVATKWLPGCKVVQEWPLTSFAAIMNTFEYMSPLKQEGYVVVDSAFRRVKVKHPGYVALHHAKGGLSRKAFVEITRKGETSEILAAFPEFGEMMDDAEGRVNGLINELERDYGHIDPSLSQKEFAAEALKSRCSTALFQVRAKKVDSVDTYVREMHIDKLMELLGYRNAPPKVEDEF